MHAKSALRLVAGLGVAGALVATTAIPAAARAAAELSIYFGDTTIAADGPGKTDAVIMHASEPVVLPEATMKFDATGLAGVATIAEDQGINDCTPESEQVLVCHKPYEIGIDEGGLNGPFDIVLTAAQGAAVDAEGTLKIILSAPGFNSATTQARVRVGEGVDLAAGPNATASAAPGATFVTPARVRNAGETVAKGAVALFFTDYGIRAGTERFSNCLYDGDAVNACTFERELAPGTTYGASVPSRLDPATYAPSLEVAEIAWMTPAEFEDFTKYLKDNGFSPGQPGTGAVLALNEMAGATARGAQADTDPFNNWSYVEVKVTGTNGVDLEAVGASFDGAAGSTHDVELAVVNNGPAVLSSGRSGEEITRIKVDVPPGTTTVEVPENCFPTSGDETEWDQPGKPGARAYLCGAGLFLAPGDKLSYPFGFRIDEVIADANGAITANAACQCPTFTHDLDKSNDVAKILVNGTGGGGGGLPVTGASTGIVAAAGALLLLAGGAGFVIARRRRMRFVA